MNARVIVFAVCVALALLAVAEAIVAVVLRYPVDMGRLIGAAVLLPIVAVGSLFKYPVLSRYLNSRLGGRS